jgi:hypothetical protein
MKRRDDEFQTPGSTSEDEYFFRKDRELLAKLREQSEAKKKKAEAENRKKEYWMRCPKCGSDLKEVSYEGLIMIDRCENSKCGGIYFDKGELEIVLKAKPSLIQRIFSGNK